MVIRGWTTKNDVKITAIVIIFNFCNHLVCIFTKDYRRTGVYMIIIKSIIFMSKCHWYWCADFTLKSALPIPPVLLNFGHQCHRFVYFQDHVIVLQQQKNICHIYWFFSAHSFVCKGSCTFEKKSTIAYVYLFTYFISIKKNFIIFMQTRTYLPSRRVTVEE